MFILQLDQKLGPGVASQQDLVQEPQPLAGLILAAHPEVRRPPCPGPETWWKNGDFTGKNGGNMVVNQPTWWFKP